MKKSKVILLIILTFSLITLFCAGCDFIQYVEKSDNGQISEEIKQLQDSYVDKLYAVTSEIEYREKEQRLYEYAVLDAVNELYECHSEADLEQVYYKHLEIIGKIKTDKEYFDEELEVYKRDTLKKLNEYVDLQLYRDEQVAEIKAKLTKHLILVEQATTTIEADNAFREYQIAVYGISTDKELYGEELNKLKEELNSSLVNTYKFSNYKEKERLEVKELI